MIRRVSCLLPALMFSVVIQTSNCFADFQGATINDIDLGKQIAGPKFNPRSARGKVIYLVYWNANLPKSAQDAGEIFKLRESMGSEDILILAYQNYEMPEEDIMGKWQEAGGPDQQVPLFYKTEYPKKLTQSKTPRIMIGPRGDILFAGGQRDADKKLTELSMRMPGYIPGNRDYRRLASEARQLERTDRGIGRNIEKLQKITKGELQAYNTPEAIEEAQFMLERINAWISMEQAELDAALSGNPLPAVEISERMTKALRGSELVKPFEHTHEKFRHDREMKNEIKAAEIWLSTVQMMEQAGLSAKANKPDSLKKIQNEEGQFTPEGHRILRGIVGLVKKYPDTWGGGEAEKFAQGVGLK